MIKTMKGFFRPYQIVLTACAVPVMAASSLVPAADTAPTEVPPAQEVVATDTMPVLAATAYAVFEVETGKVIGAFNSAAVLPIASVTKLLTAATVLRTVEADAEYTVAAEDVATLGRAGRLAAGQVYPVYELLFPLLLESSNDAAKVVERETNGDIVRRMNAYAKELGAKSLTVVDASGLSAANQASVNDLLILARAFYSDLPHLFDITKLSKRAGPYVGWSNNSPVLTREYRGGKHGYTEAAGRTIVALFEEEIAGETRVFGYIILGSSDLGADVATLRSFVKKQVVLK